MRRLPIAFAVGLVSLNFIQQLRVLWLCSAMQVTDQTRELERSHFKSREGSKAFSSINRLEEAALLTPKDKPVIQEVEASFTIDPRSNTSGSPDENTSTNIRDPKIESNGKEDNLKSEEQGTKRPDCTSKRFETADPWEQGEMGELLIAIKELVNASKSLGFKKAPKCLEFLKLSEASEILDRVENFIQQKEAQQKGHSESFLQLGLVAKTLKEEKSENDEDSAEEDDDEIEDEESELPGEGKSSGDAKETLREAEEAEEEAAQRKRDLDEEEEEIKSARDAVENSEKSQPKKQIKKYSKEEGKALLRAYSMSMERLLNEMASINSGKEDYLGTEQRISELKEVPSGAS